MKKNNLPRGLRNNNPGNIRINGDLFQGEVRPSKDKSFKQFETMAYGYRAMFVILRNYIRNYKLGRHAVYKPDGLYPSSISC